MESAGRFRNCEREWESCKQFAGAKREIFDFSTSHTSTSLKKNSLVSSFSTSSALACALVLGFAAAAGEDTFIISDDPLDLSNELPSDYRNWASVLSQVLLKKEGSDESAASALERLMLATHGHLSKVANGEELLPRFHLQDPVLAAGDPLTAPPLAATAFASSATFFNYAPCVLSESYTGASGFLQGINFSPTLFSFAPTGLGVFAQGINLTPQLIYVAPTGGNIQPQGLNVQVREGKEKRFFLYI